MIEKILPIAFVALAVLSIFKGVLLDIQTSRLASAQKALTIANAANVEAKEAIKRQNDLISAYQIDMANAKAEVKALSELITEETKEQKVRIVERLIKDDSCEERLRIVEDILDEFYKHD
jgi:hypothetical protein